MEGYILFGNDGVFEHCVMPGNWLQKLLKRNTVIAPKEWRDFEIALFYMPEYKALNKVINELPSAENFWLALDYLPASAFYNMAACRLAELKSFNKAFYSPKYRELREKVDSFYELLAFMELFGTIPEFEAYIEAINRLPEHGVLLKEQTSMPEWQILKKEMDSLPEWRAFKKALNRLPQWNAYKEAIQKAMKT